MFWDIAQVALAIYVVYLCWEQVEHDAKERELEDSGESSE